MDKIMGQNILLKENISTDFQVWHSKDTTWIMKDYHFHDAFEIYLSLSDGVQYFIQDSVYPVQKADLFVFNNMDLHKTVAPSEANYERYVATFMPAYIETMSSEKTDLLECFLDRPDHFCYRVHLTEEQYFSLIALFEKVIYYSSHNQEYGAEIYKKLLLTKILLQVNSYYRNGSNEKLVNTDGEYRRIRPVIQYIHQNLNSDLSLDKLAARFFISKYHLGYLFKKATSFTVNEYIISQRIMKARELLKNNLPVSQVGEMVGYCNDSHFIRTFKKMVGTSPKQYAKKI